MLHTARIHAIFISILNNASRVLLSAFVYDNQVETLSLNHDVLYSTVTMVVAGALYSYQLTINVAFKTHSVVSIKKAWIQRIPLHGRKYVLAARHMMFDNCLPLFWKIFTRNLISFNIVAELYSSINMVKLS